MTNRTSIRYRFLPIVAILLGGLLEASPARSCFIDTDGLTDCTFSLRVATITKRPKFGTDGWSGQGELNSLASPGLLQEIADQGMSVAIGTTGDSGGGFAEVDQITFEGGGECQVRGPRQNRLLCKNAQGTFKLSPRSAPDFFRVAVRGTSRALVLPPIESTPLAIVLLTPDTIRRGDPVSPCNLVVNYKKLICRRLP